VPILEFIDHGPNVQPAANIDPILQQYAALHAKVKHRVAKPGDRVAVSGLEWRIMTAAGQVITAALPGAGAPNPYCAVFKPHTVNPVSGQPVGNTEDEQSVGSHITFGKFRVLYLGDFTWNNEFELNCPKQPHRGSRCVRGVTSWAAQLEFAVARERHSAARHNHQQRHPQRRTT
jgi:hypothetical protein